LSNCFVECFDFDSVDECVTVEAFKDSDDVIALLLNESVMLLLFIDECDVILMLSLFDESIVLSFNVVDDDGSSLLLMLMLLETLEFAY
jgi:hypothetical protein